MIHMKGRGFYDRFGPRYVASRDPEAVHEPIAVESLMVNENTLLWGVMEFGNVIEVGGKHAREESAPRACAGSHR